MLLFATILPFLTPTFTTLDYYNEFLNWTKSFNKSYDNHDDVYEAYLNFVDKSKYIDLFKQDYPNNDLFEVQLDHNADQFYVPNPLLSDGVVPYYNYTDNLGISLPIEFDWRDKAAVSSVKNQGKCGDCYAFSALGAIESQYLIHQGVELNLSPSQVVDCSYSEGNDGCDGGLQPDVFEYIKKYGIEDTKAYPYNAKDGVCMYNKTNVVLKIRDYKYVYPGIDKLKQNLVNNGPISISMAASSLSFQLYKSGIYVNNNCYKNEIDHAILLVGYGSSGDVDYWIIKNSWGTGWGEDGFGRIAIDTDCGISQAGGSYPIL